MNNSIISERERKCKIIVNMYEKRKYRQQDIAKELHMPISRVREILQAYGFEHGKKKSKIDPNNLNEGQSIDPLIDFQRFAFLDQYDF